MGIICWILSTRRPDRRRFLRSTNRTVALLIALCKILYANDPVCSAPSSAQPSSPAINRSAEIDISGNAPIQSMPHSGSRRSLAAIVETDRLRRLSRQNWPESGDPGFHVHRSRQREVSTQDLPLDTPSCPQKARFAQPAKISRLHPRLVSRSTLCSRPARSQIGRQGAA